MINNFYIEIFAWIGWLIVLCIIIYNIIKSIKKRSRDVSYLEPLLELGFSDITSIRPIRIFETIFGNAMYNFSYRLYRKTDNIVTEVMIGEEFGNINIVCFSYDINSSSQVLSNNLNIPIKTYNIFLNTFIKNNEVELTKIIENGKS